MRVRAETIFNVWGEPEVFMRVTWKVLAEWEIGWRPVTGG